MNHYARLVAIYPTSYGFGFVVYDQRKTLFDWGHASVSPNTRGRCLERIAALFSWYTPEVVVLEDVHHPSSRRKERVRKLIDRVVSFAKGAKAEVVTVSQERLESAFLQEGVAHMESLIQMISDLHPQLRFKAPRPRRIWLSEQERKSIFMAAALALTFISGPSETAGKTES